MTFPVVDREPVRLPTLAGHDDELWDALIELSEVRPGEWTLIGGQMVFLHAIEQGAIPPRVSTDLDVLVNARIAGRPLAAFALELEDLGFEQDGISPDGIAHRYRRNRVTIDVLAPEGLGERTDLTTTPPGRTLQVPGGTRTLDARSCSPASIECGTNSRLTLETEPEQRCGSSAADRVPNTGTVRPHVTLVTVNRPSGVL